MVVNRLYKEKVLKEAGIQSALVQKPGEQSKSLFGIIEDDFFIGFDCETKQFVRYYIVEDEQLEGYLENNIPVVKRFLNYEFKHCDDQEFQQMYQMYRKEFGRYLEGQPLSEDSTYVAAMIKKLSDIGLTGAMVQKPGEHETSMLGIMKDDFFIGFDYKNKQFARYFTSGLIIEEPEQYLENNIPVVKCSCDFALKQYDSNIIKAVYEMYKNNYNDYLQNNLIENNHTLDKILEVSGDVVYATYNEYAEFSMNDDYYYIRELIEAQKRLRGTSELENRELQTRAFSMLYEGKDGKTLAMPIEQLSRDALCLCYEGYPVGVENMATGDSVVVTHTIPLDFSRMSDPNINYIHELCMNYRVHLAEITDTSSYSKCLGGDRR